jgi:hypothetical protein
MEVSSQLTPGEKVPLYPSDRTLGGPTPMWTLNRRKEYLALSEIYNPNSLVPLTATFIWVLLRALQLPGRECDYSISASFVPLAPYLSSCACGQGSCYLRLICTNKSVKEFTPRVGKRSPNGYKTHTKRLRFFGRLYFFK